VGGQRPPGAGHSVPAFVGQGATWSEPVKINDAEPGRQRDFDEEEPAISVAPGGRVDVAWLDYRDYTFKAGPQSQNAAQDVYMASSSRGGEKWTANMRVTDRSIDRRLSDVWFTGVHSALGLQALDTWAYGHRHRHQHQHQHRDEGRVGAGRRRPRVRAGRRCALREPGEVVEVRCSHAVTRTKRANCAYQG
jgi:hypothetical protein